MTLAARTAGQMLAAAATATALAVIALLAIARVEWPAYNSSNQLHALTTVGQFFCLAGVFAAGVLWRRGRRLLARIASVVFLSAFSVVTLAMPLGATRLYDRIAPHIFSSSQVANGKPAPDLFLFAAAQMKARPAACVVVEDSLAGIRGGIAAGMTVLGFHGGSHCRAGHADSLQAAGATLVFDDIRQLPAILSRLGQKTGSLAGFSAA